MNLKDWTKQERGRQALLARHLGVPSTNVCQWVSGDKRPSHKTAVLIEAYTGGLVTRKELYPKEWRLIWPEIDAPVDFLCPLCSSKGALNAAPGVSSTTSPRAGAAPF